MSRTSPRWFGLVGAFILTGCRQPLPDLDDAHRDLADALAVFPAAEGFGTDTLAGRGGEVFIVTNLDDDGPGSFREAVLADGPRTVLFEVGGTIWLTTEVYIDEPYLTIAGHSGPAPGVTLAGAGIVISTHDVLVRHMRLRPGDTDVDVLPKNRDAIGVIGESGGREVYNVVIDHCSLSWGVDETASTWYAGVRDVTWSNNVIAEGLAESLHPEGSHSKGLLIGNSSRRIAVLRNLFAHNDDRNPVVKEDTSTLIANNLVYDPGRFAIVHYGARGCCPILATIEGNHVIAGPETRESAPAVWLTKKTHEDSRVYAADNGHEGMNGERLSERGEHVWTDVRPVSVTPLTLMPADEVEAAVLANVGARRADGDAIDERILQSVRDRDGGLIDSPGEVGGQPDPEMTRETLTLPPDPSGDDDGDGYTNLEHWLHQRAADVSG